MRAPEPPRPEEPTASGDPSVSMVGALASGDPSVSMVGALASGDPSVPMVGAVASGDPSDPSDPLLGFLASGELAAFSRLAEGAGRAPDLPGRVELASFAAEAMNHFARVREVLADRGRDVVEVMGPFTGPLDAFHAGTAPRDWDESLVATYLGRGLIVDLAEALRERATLSDPGAALVGEVMPGPAHHEFVQGRVTAVTDPRVRARLALGARRWLGEALAATDAVLDAHPTIAAELTGSVDGDRGPLFKQVKRRHGRRVGALGL